MQTAINTCKKHGINGIVCIGGDGTPTAEQETFRKEEFPASAFPAP